MRFFAQERKEEEIEIFLKTLSLLYRFLISGKGWPGEPRAKLDAFKPFSFFVKCRILKEGAQNSRTPKALFRGSRKSRPKICVEKKTARV